MYIWIILTALFKFWSFQDGNPKPFLVIDPKGHNAVINQLAYSDLTNELISVGDDKTIRLWSTDDQVLNRTFRIFSAGNGPEGMIYTADISFDSRYLAVAGYSADNEIKIIDLQTKRIVDFLVKHKNIVTDVAFSPNGELLASASADESIILWKKSNDQPLTYLHYKTLWQHQAKVNSIAFSPDGKRLVSVSDDQTSRIWNLEEESIPSIELKNHLGAVKKVGAGKTIFLTGDEKGILNAWNWEGVLVNQVTQFGSAIKVIEISESGTVAIVSADRQVLINLNDVSTTRSLFPTDLMVTSALFKGEMLYVGQGREGNIIALSLPSFDPKYALSGKGKSFKSLFIKNGEVGFHNELSTIPNLIFNLDSETIIRDKSAMVGFKGAVLSNGTFNFIKPSDVQLLFGSSFSIKNEPNDGRILSYTLLPEGNVAVGSDRTLKIYSSSGKLVSTLSGHNGQVLSMVANNKYLVTYGGDQIIKFWSIQEGFSLAFNLFITKDYQWIYWDEAGNYNASAGGEEYLTWQINEKPEKLADFFDVSRFSKKFLTESLAEAKQGARDQSVSKIETLIPNQPQIVWKSPETYQITTTDRNYRLQADIFSDLPVEKIKILVEGRALPDKRGVSVKTMVDEILPINSYKTTIQIFASTADSKIISEKRVIINPDLEGKVGVGREMLDIGNKPDIHFLGIGVSEFRNPKFNLNYADDDAASVHNIFASKSSPVFDEFHGELILNDQATKQNILDALDKLVSKVQPKDQVVLFFASHGINDQGLYYVLTHDVDENNFTGTCVSWDEIAAVLGKLPCKVLLFLDTCHSGALGANLASNEQYAKNTEALRKMGSAEIGVVIMSGSTGDESSLESEEWSHGAFTLSLIEGIQGKKADVKQDGIIELRELDLFISNNVYELTGGKQNPTTQKPSTISKFVIY